MLFNSWTFADFFAIVLPLHCSLGRRRQNVLLLKPLRRETHESIEGSPISAARERRLREVVLDANAMGADHVIEFRDAAGLGVADDETIFIDCGHLNRTGAEIQTRKLAEILRGLGLLESLHDRPTRPGSVGGQSAANGSGSENLLTDESTERIDRSQRSSSRRR
jgi:hypothetical protein